MTDRPRPYRRVPSLIAIAAAVVAASMLSACGQSGGDTRDVTDASGLFHVKVPAEWQSTVEPGVTSIYANEELPSAENDPGALAVVVLLSETTTDVPVPEALVGYVDFWGTSRNWTGVETSEPYDVTVGTRPASRVDVTGIGGDGKPFKAAYIWARTNDREVLITAVTPPENWDTYAEDLDSLLVDWYWHRPEGTSADTTSTP